MQEGLARGAKQALLLGGALCDPDLPSPPELAAREQRMGLEAYSVLIERSGEGESGIHVGGAPSANLVQLRLRLPGRESEQIAGAKQSHAISRDLDPNIVLTLTVRQRWRATPKLRPETVDG